MSAAAHLIDDFARRFEAPLLSICLVSWLAAFVVLVRGARETRWGSRVLWTGVTIFGVVVLTDIAAGTFVAAIGRDEVLAALPPGQAAVWVDGAPSAEPRAILRALRDLHDESPDHSEAMRRHEVVVATAGGGLKLWLAQDSKDPEDWWVFQSDYEMNRLNPIGHIQLETLS